MSDHPQRATLPFVSTKEYLRFGELSDASRQDRSIGITHGLPGIGKTRSARQYVHWDRIEPLLPEQLFTLARRNHSDGQFPHKPFASLIAPSFQEILPCRTCSTRLPGRIEREVMALCAMLSYLVEAAEQAN